MAKLDLTNTSLVCISSNKIEESLKALEICLKYANFYDTILFSDVDTKHTHKIAKLNSLLDYNKFSYYDLPRYISSDFILIIQWDGFIVNPSAWTDDFFKYDYIGAPWPWNKLCGNSGFSMRSKKFLESQTILSKNNPLEKDQTNGDHGLHDDVMLCIKLRDQFTSMGCTYATTDIGYKFSTEHGNYNDYQSFGFHDFRQQPQFRNIIYR